MIKIKLDRIFRNEGYTSDGFFLIKTELENYYLKRQIEEDGKPLMSKLFNDIWVSGRSEELVKIGEPYILDNSDIKVQKYSCKEFDTFINPEYLWFFKSLKNLKFRSTGTYAPLQVLSENKETKQWELIGLIMPIRVDKI